MARKTLLLVALALVAGGLQPSVAAEQPSTRAVALPLAAFYGYATPSIVINKGDVIVFTNLDADRHDFVQDVSTDGHGGKRNVPWCQDEHGDGHDHGPGCPVFWSELIGMQESVKVKGLDRVKPGETYTFFCTSHHSMKGSLIVRE